DDAHVEAEPLHPGPVEGAPELALLAGVAQSRDPRVQSTRAEAVEEPADALRAAHRDDRDALGVEIAAAALRERLERDLVACPLDKYDRAARLSHRASDPRRERRSHRTARRPPRSRAAARRARTTRAGSGTDPCRSLPRGRGGCSRRSRRPRSCTARRRRTRASRGGRRGAAAPRARPP